MKTVLDRRKLARLLDGLRQGNTAAWLARQIGIDGQRLRAYLREENDAQLDALVLIANYMEISVDELQQQICYPDNPEKGADLDLYELLAQLPNDEKLKAAKYLLNAVA